MNIEEELKKILEDDGNDIWQTKSIKALALCILEQRKDICVIKKQVSWYKWLLASIIVLLIANLLTK